MRYVKSAVILLIIVLTKSTLSTAQPPENPPPQQEYTPPVTVAVITFQTLPEEMKDNQWLGAGISEDLSDRLKAAEFESLSIFERRDSTKITRKIGGLQGSIAPDNSSQIVNLKRDFKSKGVDYLVLGSIQSPGKWDNPEAAFILNAKIVSVKREPDSGEITEAINMSGTFGSGGARLFAAQAELSAKVAKALGVNTDDFKGSPLSRGNTSNIQAFKSYSEAMMAFDAEDYETAKRSFFKAYQVAAGSYHAALLMFEKSDELRIEMIEAEGHGVDIATEIEEGDRLLEELEKKQVQHLTTIKFVRAQRAVWKQKRYLTAGNKIKADEQGGKAIDFLSAFNALNDSLSWRITNVKDFLLSDDTVFVNTYRGIAYQPEHSTLLALHQKTKKELWRFETPKGIQRMELSGDILFVDTYTGKSYQNPDSSTLIARDKNTGKELWRFEIQGGIKGFKLFDDLLFIETFTGFFYEPKTSGIIALEQKSGRELWRFAMKEKIDHLEMHGKTLFVEIFIGEERSPDFSVLIALQKATGKELWRFEPGCAIHYFRPADQAIFVKTFIGEDFGIQKRSSLISLSAESGEEFWRLDTNRGMAHFHRKDGIIYVEQFTGNSTEPDDSAIVALDENTGKELWRFEPDSRIFDFELSQGFVFVDTFIGDDWLNPEKTTLHALNIETGELLWEFEKKENIWNVKRIGESIFIMNEGVSVLDAQTGRLTGSYPNSHWIQDFQVIDNVLYYPSENEFFIFDLKTGMMQDRMEIRGSIDRFEVRDDGVFLLSSDLYRLPRFSVAGAVEDTTAMLVQAEAEMQLGNHEKARETLLEIVGLKQGLAAAWQLLFQTCTDMGDMSCMNTAFLNIHLRASTIPEYGHMKDFWMRHTPFIDIGDEFHKIQAEADNPQVFRVNKNKVAAFYDVRKGKEQWRTELPGKIYSYEQSGDVVYVETEMVRPGHHNLTHFVALDVETGTELWRFSTDGGIKKFTLSDQIAFLHIYIGGWAMPDQSIIAALDIKTGRELWQFKVDGGIEAFELSAGVLFADTLIGENSSEPTFSTLEAINMRTGKELWRLQIEGGIDGFALSKDKVFANTFRGDRYRPDEARVLALDVKTGRELWRVNVIDGTFLDSVVFDDTLLLEVKYGDHASWAIVAIDKEKGGVLWQFETAGSIHEYLMSDDTLFVATFTGLSTIPESNRFINLDMKTGEERWAFESLGGMNRAMLSGDDVFVQLYSGEWCNPSDASLVILDQKTGNGRLRYDTVGGINNFNVSGDTIIINTYEGTSYSPESSSLTALDIKTGEKLWNYNFGKADIEFFLRPPARALINLNYHSAGLFSLLMDTDKAMSIFNSRN